MHRVVAALAVVAALVAAGVPVAAAMPPRCADCCRQGTLHPPDASMPDCCRVAPADRAVARADSGRRPAVPRTVVAPATGMSLRPVLATTHAAPLHWQRRARGAQVLRI